MKFSYRPVIAIDPISGEPHMIMRPEIPVTIAGSVGVSELRALLDTGADNTILPVSLARDLGIELRPTMGANAAAFGGQQLVTFVGEATFTLTDEAESCSWKAEVLFFDFADPADETLILGNAGCLDFFTATFDGQECVVTLVSNEDLPTFA